MMAGQPGPEPFDEDEDMDGISPWPDDLVSEILFYAARYLESDKRGPRELVMIRQTQAQFFLVLIETFYLDALGALEMEWAEREAWSATGRKPSQRKARTASGLS